MARLSAGHLTARVRCSGRDIASIDLILDRPLRVLSGFHGKPPADCLRLLPLLFPLCGTAHVLAALQATEAAASMVPASAHAAARNTLALADMLAAQIWRSCIDWAHLTRTPAVPGPVAQARRLVERIALALYPEGDWQRIGGGRLAPDGAALAAARAELKQLRAILDLTGALVTLRTEMVRAMAGTEPEWTAFVDGCFADMVDATTANLEVLDAQLQAMVELPATPVSSALLAVEAGHGKGIVPTARGELCYELDLDAAGVRACRVCAPTDRVFAADGPVVTLLQRLRQAEDPLLAVRWIVAAYDPCIEVQIEQAAD